MKSNLVFALSSLLLAVGLTACPPGGGGTPGTSGQINATFSNPSGTTSITLEPLSAGAITHKTTISTAFVGIQGNREIELFFSPPLTGNKTCSIDALTCSILVGKSGTNPGLVFAQNGTITATISAGSINITGNGTFTQKDGVTFDAQVNATIPYTP